MTTSAPTHVPAVVIGAGVSGLTCAYTLRQRGIDAHLFESADRAGGVIRSVSRGGFLFELGPQSFTLTDYLRQLTRELRLEAQLQLAPAKLPRYLLEDGELAAAPLDPPAFFFSPLFGVRTKFNVIRDAIGRTNPPPETAAGDESIAHFTRRKFGNELLEKLVGPFVSGIYAGNPEKLSLRGAFPSLYAAETAHGSVIRGLLRARRSASGSPTLATFQHGNQTFTDALAAALGSAFHLNVAATRILTSPSWAPGQFIVEFREQPMSAAPLYSVHADHVILASPAGVSAKLLEPLDPSLASLLTSIEYVPVSIVSLGYHRAAVQHSLHAFGFLAARNSGLRVLGSVWNSSLFPERAPADSVLLTSFVGGSGDLSAVKLTPKELETVVHRELARILGITEAPIISNVHIWPQAIPQYDLQHHRRTQVLGQKIAAFPGLALAGNYLDGPAIGAVVDRARKLADYVLDGPPR